MLVPVVWWLFLHVQTQPADSSVVPSRIRPVGTTSTFPLDMSPSSVDDMYYGCKKKMEKKVQDNYINEEMIGTFQKAWNATQICKNRNVINEDGLSEDHIRAICAYTSGRYPLYAEFNNAVRTNKTEYSSPLFKFHTLHFLLTDAIRVLKKKEAVCFTTYRRTTSVFNGKKNDIVRFGIFASSSFLKNLTHFGRAHCFEIKTCFGADLKSYPAMKDKEKEVLIPPYEIFNITEVVLERVRKVLNCDVLYKLESVGIHSESNCKAAGT